MGDKEDKLVSECLDVGFEYIGRGTRSGYSQVKCMVCGGVGEYRQDHIRKDNVRCKHCHESKMREECDAAGFTWLDKVDANRSRCSCNVCGYIDVYEQGHIRAGGVRCEACYETKMREECSAIGFTWLGKVDAKNSKCQCNVCGHVDEFQQGNIRAGNVTCTKCHETKMQEECLACNFTWLCKVDRASSKCVCNVCGNVEVFQQGHIRRGGVKCTKCYETRMREECSAEGFTWIEKVDSSRSRCSCNACGHVDVFEQSAMRHGKVRCSNCQIIKYKSATKPDWEFLNHFRDGRETYVNLKHSCGDSLVKVKIGHFLTESYSCPHCMHTHYNDPSYFYVIQVRDIIKLGISNRPTQRYTKYGLPEDSTIIEHLRIPLETKRDALVVESHAKQLVKDFKIPTDIAKQVFTKSGFNECYSMESLEYLLTI